jgi:hypothetical protein
MTYESRVMEKPAYTITQITDGWPSSLKTAEDISQAIGISAERLIQLADSGYAPHWRIDNGLPFFRLGEIKEWLSENVVERIKGRPLPQAVIVSVTKERISDYRNVPEQLRQIPGLVDITGEARRSGIYFLCQDNELLYVGQSVSVSARISSHHHEGKFNRVIFMPWPPDDLNSVEGALIRALRPPLNGQTATGKMMGPRTNATDDTIMQLILEPKSEVA